MSAGASGPGSRASSALLVALLATFASLVATGGCLDPDASESPGARGGAPTSTGVVAEESADPILARLADKPLRITRHGHCRMACRQISEDEVVALLDEGRVVPERTRSDGECVSYAVEGRTDDGQDVRIVYADCERETRVVTTIDLGREWPCECR